MYWPEGIKAGSSYDELVQNIDFAPTFLELAGVELSNAGPLDGVSLKASMQGHPAPVHDHLFFEIGFARGVMTKDWKYIAVRYDEKSQQQIDEGITFTGWNGHTYTRPYYIRNTHLGYHSVLLNPNYFDADQLYDLGKDPLETKNVYPQNGPEAEKLKAALSSWLSGFPGRPYGEFTGF